MERTDMELITKSLGGSQEAFAELVGRYKKLVYSTVYHYIKDTEEVNDISQEVFIKIYKALGSYNPQYKFSTWTVRISTNLCLDILRKKKFASVPIEEIETVVKEENTPEKRYIMSERSIEIKKAINRLPEKYRTLIVLYHQKGASYNDMSLILKQPMSIIKNRLFRARRALRESLAGMECG